MTSPRTLIISSRILSSSVLIIAVLTVLVAITAPAQQADTLQPSAKPSAASVATAQARILETYGKLPLSFEANQGQADTHVKFLSRTGGYSLFLTEDEAVLALRGNELDTHTTKTAGAKSGLHPASIPPKPGDVLRMKLRNANPAAPVTGVDELTGITNYFIGNDPAKWRTSVPAFAKVKYEGIYSGIDLVYYGNQQQLEYDFIVAPGADPRRIAFDVRGAKRFRRDQRGDLVLKMREGEIRWRKPVAYQEKDGSRHEITARYAITAANRVGFELAHYDGSRPLYIDPMIYSTYLGGSLSDSGTAIAVDSAGNAYITGSTVSTNFPTVNPIQAANGGDGTFTNAFVTKLNPTGSALIYSTYLGGTGLWNSGAGISVDSAGNAYVTGRTCSADFPTMNPLQPVYGGNTEFSCGDAFVTKINAAGSALVYSTFLGGSGSDWGYGIAVDGSGNAYVTGQTESTDFPTMNPLQPVYGGGPSDAFVAKLNPAGSALVYSTYLGGSNEEDLYFGTGGIAVDNAGNAYVTGSTESGDFPTANALQPTLNAQGSAFVSKINPAGSAFVYSTFLGGGKGNNGNGIAADGAGNAYVTGTTYSTDFPVTPGAFQSICGNSGFECDYGSAFVSVYNATGSAFVYSTYLSSPGGGSVGNAIAADASGTAYVTGITGGSFPTQSSLQQYKGNNDAFVTRFNAQGSALVYSTYLGGSGPDAGYGIALDSSGNAYVTGQTYSTNFPTTLGALQTVCNGGSNCKGEGDAFVAKILIAAVTTTMLSSTPNPSSYGQAVVFSTAVTSAAGAPPDGESVTFMQGQTVLATEALSGGSASFTTSALPTGTNVITAVYGGDSNYAPSTSKAVKQVVSGYATSTALVSSLTPSIYGQKVTWTATVTTSGSTTPTGRVNFNWDVFSIGTATLNSSGVATLTRSNLSADPYPLTAVYTGDSYNAGSASPILNQVITQTTSTATITSSSNPSTEGQAVTFTAEITSPTTTPTGPVTFTAGKTTLGTVELSNGKATLTTSTLPVGSTTVTVTYPWNSDIAESSASVTQVVQQ
jgi:hypothetical protein